MRRFLLLVALWSVAAASHAAYALASPPPGWGGSAGAWTFGGSAAANAPWVNGSAAGGVSVNVGGRAVTMPMTMRLAANAPQVIARAALSTPYGRAASFIAWALAAGWVWSEVEQRWTVPESVPGTMQTVLRYCVSPNPNSCSGLALHPSPSEACASAPAPVRYDGPEGVYTFGTCTFTDPSITNPATLNRTFAIAGQYVEVEVCPPGSAPLPGGGCSGDTHPATEGDADQLAQAQPLPDAVPNEAQEFLPLPVQLPELDPIRVPMGEPVPVPNTAPQAYEQPVADVRPAPTADEPFRVDVQPRTVTGTNPNGVTEVEHLDGSEATSDPASAPGLCDQYPDILACRTLGSAPSDQVPKTGRSVDYEPVSIGGASGCPAPMPIGEHEFSFTPLCNNLQSIRPLIIAIGFFSAALIVAHALRA